MLARCVEKATLDRVAERERSEAQGKKLLLAGAVTQTVGLALVGTVSNSLGSWVTLGGWLLLVYGLHAYGRAGEARGKAEKA